MSDIQAIADRVEIEALRGKYTDAGMMRDYDRFVSLFIRDAASGRAYIAEFGRFRDGSSHLNCAVYHDRYQRTPDGVGNSPSTSMRSDTSAPHR